MSSATKLTVLSQTALVGFVAVCVALMPGFLFERDEGGVSNYGVHVLTVPFYTLAFGLSGVLLLLAAQKLRNLHKHRSAATLFTIVGYSLLLVLASTYTYKVNDFFRDLHIALAIWVFCLNLTGSLWLAVAFSRRRAVWLLLGGQLAGFVLGTVTFLGILHALFVAQILSMASFGGLLVVAAQQPARKTRAAHRTR